MSMDHLAKYLNDHLAGATAALGLLDRLVKTYREEPTAQFFNGLRSDVRMDRDALRKLIAALGVEESAARKTLAWFLEKLSRAPIRLKTSRHRHRDWGLLLALEALALGITGKQLLWRALAASLPPSVAADVNYAHLEERALQQKKGVEAKRLEVARVVLRP